MWKKAFLYTRNIQAINRAPLCDFLVLLQTKPTENFQENRRTLGTCRKMHGKHQKGHRGGITRAAQRCHNHWQNFQASKERGFERNRDWGRGREGMGRWIEKWPEAQHLKSWTPWQTLWLMKLYIPHSRLSFGHWDKFATILKSAALKTQTNTIPSNLKRKQRHLSIPACQRLAQHLSQALPNLLLSQFHFKPFSRLKDGILQETIKHWTRSTLKPCNENYKRNSKYSGSEDQIFPASPKVNKLFLLRAAGGEHRQPKIVIYFSCKPFLTSRKPRMEIKEVQPDPSDFSSSPIYFKHHQLKGQWWH